MELYIGASEKGGVSDSSFALKLILILTNKKSGYKPIKKEKLL